MPRNNCTYVRKFGTTSREMLLTIYSKHNFGENSSHFYVAFDLHKNLKHVTLAQNVCFAVSQLQFMNVYENSMVDVSFGLVYSH